MGDKKRLVHAFPTHPRYFKEEMISDVLKIEDHMLDIMKILEIEVEPHITKVKLVQTEPAITYDGYKTTGYQVMVTVKFEGKILYTTEKQQQSVQGIHFDMIRNFLIVVPEKVEDLSVQTAYSRGLLKVQPYIETVYGRPLDVRTIQCCIAIFLHLVVR